MFYGDKAECEVVVTDVTPEIFQKFLDIIYGKEGALEDLKKALVLFGVRRLVEKYKMKSLDMPTMTVRVQC